MKTFRELVLFVEICFKCSKGSINRRVVGINSQSSCIIIQSNSKPPFPRNTYRDFKEERTSEDGHFLVNVTVF